MISDNAKLSAIFLLTALCLGCSDPEPLNVSGDSNSKESDPAVKNVSNGWPSLYGPNHDSISTESDLKLDFDEQGPPLVWKQPVGKGYSAPVIKDDKVIMLSRIDDEEVVVCLDTETGNENWSFKYPTDFECKEDGYSSGPYSTPAIGDGFVVTVSAQGKFHCLDLDNGETFWSRDLFDEYKVKQKEWGVSSSPLIFDDLVIFNLGAQEKKAGIVALEAKTGETKWESTEEDYCHATPVVARMHGENLLFAMVATGLYCLNPTDGKVLWNVEHQQRAEDAYHQNAVSPAIYQNKVCITCGPRISPGFRCFEVQSDGSYDESWKNIRLLNSQYTNLVAVGGYLFGFSSVKAGGPEFVCIDLNKGKAAWKAKPDLGRGNLVAVEDRLLILGEKGILACFELSGNAAKEIWRTKNPILKKPCYTSMALSNGLLFARNEKEIVCLSLRK